MAIPLHERMVRSMGGPYVLDKYSLGRSCNYKNWNESTLQRACEAVHKGMSIRRAAEEYAIPRSTLHDHISRRVVFGAKSGPKVGLGRLCFIVYLLFYSLIPTNFYNYSENLTLLFFNYS